MLEVAPANERQNAGRLEGVLDGPERSDVGGEHASATPTEFTNRRFSNFAADVVLTTGWKRMGTDSRLALLPTPECAEVGKRMLKKLGQRRFGPAAIGTREGNFLAVSRDS